MVIGGVSDVAFNPEDMIRWEELSDSLQERFRRIEAAINNSAKKFDGLTNNYRITISPEPPLYPEKDRDVWFDTNINTFRFYTDKGGASDDGNTQKQAAWEITRAAWYGGHKSDLVHPAIQAPTTPYSRLKSMIWISNIAKNNQYTTKDELPRICMYTIPEDGWYRIQDHSALFIYNAQYNYTHDGGQLRVDMVVQRKDNGYKEETLYNTTYDSQSKFRAYMNQTDSFPEFKVQLKKGDRLFSVATTARNPQSTDGFEITQISSFYVYKLNYGSIDTQVGNATHDKYDKYIPSDTLNPNNNTINTPPVERLPIPYINKIGGVFVPGTDNLSPVKDYDQAYKAAKAGSGSPSQPGSGGGGSGSGSGGSPSQPTPTPKPSGPVELTPRTTTVTASSTIQPGEFFIENNIEYQRYREYVPYKAWPHKQRRKWVDKVIATGRTFKPGTTG